MYPLFYLYRNLNIGTVLVPEASEEKLMVARSFDHNR